jgi:hypothetical protein
MTWFETSDECPTCRTEQDTDPLIVFKKRVEDNIRVKYRDAVRSLQNEVQTLRTRRPRNIFPRRILHDEGEVHGQHA